MCKNSHQNILFERLSRGGEPDNVRDCPGQNKVGLARDGGWEARAHCFTQPSPLCDLMINTSAF